MSIKENLARNLKNYMTENGKKLDPFAEELQIARSSLQKYLNGTGNPNMDTIEQMAEKMKISICALIGEPSEKKETDREVTELYDRLVEGYRNLLVYIMGTVLLKQIHEDNNTLK